MGAQQSNRQERPRKPRNLAQSVIQINRTDPDLQEALEAYGSVGLDPAIVERIIQAQEREMEAQKQQITEMEARELNQMLGEVNLPEVNRQPQQQQSNETEHRQKDEQQKQQFNEADVHKMNRQFDETANRVERIFLSKHQPNACAENERAIIECLAQNPTKVLLCQHLQPAYKECIERAKAKLIQQEAAVVQ